MQAWWQLPSLQSCLHRYEKEVLEIKFSNLKFLHPPDINIFLWYLSFFWKVLKFILLLPFLSQQDGF